MQPGKQGLVIILGMVTPSPLCCAPTCCRHAALAGCQQSAGAPQGDVVGGQVGLTQPLTLGLGEPEAHTGMQGKVGTSASQYRLQQRACKVVSMCLKQTKLKQTHVEPVVLIPSTSSAMHSVQRHSLERLSQMHNDVQAD